MHELSIATALVEQVQAAVSSEDGARVVRVTVRVGALSGVDPEALNLAFPIACEGTVVEGAELAIEHVSAEVECRSCGSRTAPPFPFFACESCGSVEVEIASGRDLLLQSVEIES
jgi:hydrogenase nickel incorporation protein HypA/HybF